MSRPAWQAPALEHLVSKEELEAVEHDVRCPACGSKMVFRWSRKPGRQPSPFYGCPRYPGCKEIVNAHVDGRPAGDPDAVEPPVQVHASFATLFERLWVEKHVTEAEAYTWAASVLEVPESVIRDGNLSGPRIRILLEALELDFDITG